MEKMTDIMKMDLYLLLDISYQSTEQEIKKAYRKKALVCHPDKNPDNPKAADLFRQLSKALEILTDVTAKSAYDRLLNARKASSVRNRQLDSKRKKLKDELEARERAAKEEVMTEAEAEDRLSKEIERLRKEGSKQLEKENEIMRQKIEEEIKSMFETKPQYECSPRLKVKPKTKSCAFDEKRVREYFSQFGNICCLVMSKNNKRAIIEYNQYDSALSVMDCEHDLYKVEWIGEQPVSTTNDSTNNSQSFGSSLSNNVDLDNDYESLVLRNLRLAEERKRLIRQMQEEEQLN